MSVETLFNLFENHQEYLPSDFGELLEIATRIKTPRDFKIPKNIDKQVKNSRADYVKSKMVPTTSEDQEDS